MSAFANRMRTQDKELMMFKDHQTPAGRGRLEVTDNAEDGPSGATTGRWARRTSAQRWVSVIAASITAGAVFATPSHASNPYTARGVCGSSFTAILGTHDLGGKAVLSLLRSPSTGETCAVTIKTTRVGEPTSVEAWLTTPGVDWAYDKGTYRYYAGPVRRRTLEGCVAYAGGHDGRNWTSPNWLGCPTPKADPVEPSDEPIQAPKSGEDHTEPDDMAVPKPDDKADDPGIAGPDEIWPEDGATEVGEWDDREHPGSEEPGTEVSDEATPPLRGPGRTKLSFALYGQPGGRITCRFDGYRTRRAGRHEGIDIKRSVGSPVKALLAGRVTAVVRGALGRRARSTIAIYNSEFNRTVVYLHATPRAGLSKGDPIRRGERIGTESWRGVTSKRAAHTHVEMRLGRRTRAAVSMGERRLDNPSPTGFWRARGYDVR